MTDASSFRRALRQAHADALLTRDRTEFDFLRAVFADFLEERGEPEAALVRAKWTYHTGFSRGERISARRRSRLTRGEREAAQAAGAEMVIVEHWLEIWTVELPCPVAENLVQMGMVGYTNGRQLLHFEERKLRVVRIVPPVFTETIIPARIYEEEHRPDIATISYTPNSPRGVGTKIDTRRHPWGLCALFHRQEAKQLALPECS